MLLQNAFVCFVYEKAFNRVQHKKLIDISRNIRVDSIDVRIIENFYLRQKATMRMESSREKIKLYAALDSAAYCPHCFLSYIRIQFSNRLPNNSELEYKLTKDLFIQ